ncbi:hypothetical protein ACGFNU_15000 [Spirillospora sp. NPDC048911]|uniref:hypothetical protein n=1 Tax=Spirillospora sp. NPDC048911 TaxID=3364527 RepID=UPI003711765F
MIAPELGWRRLARVITAGLASTATQCACLDYRYVLAIDVESFSTLSARDQATVQQDLHRLLNQAAERAGLDRKRWQRQPGGDGELAVLPLGTNGLDLVADFPRELARALAESNSQRPRDSRIRLRVAIHHGTLAPGCLGPVGQAPIVVSRLLDAALLRQALTRRPNEELVLIISAGLYEDVIETRFCGLDPADFDAVDVRAKGVSYAAYIYSGCAFNSDTAPVSAAEP